MAEKEVIEDHDRDGPTKSQLLSPVEVTSLKNENSPTAVPDGSESLADTKHSRSNSTKYGGARANSDAQEIRSKVVIDLSKERARQRSKYNSKRSTQQVGRPKGNKAKQDNRIKLDKSGVWE